MTTPTAPTRAEIDKLNTISHIIENWIFFDKEKRDREGLETTDETHIMSPPTWPSHGQLKEWVKVIRAAKSGGARFTDPPEDTAEFVLVPRNRTKEMHDAMFDAMPDKLFLLSDTDALWWAAIKAWLVKP